METVEERLHDKDGGGHNNSGDVLDETRGGERENDREGEIKWGD